MDSTQTQPRQLPLANEYDILVATFSPQGDIVYRNEAWKGIFGGSDRPWRALSDQDQGLAASYIKDATRGALVTNVLFLLHVDAKDQPVPVLLNYIPINLNSESAADAVGAMITGEILVEPTSWMNSQTPRHRMETLGRMTMGIAHDFNNLLSGILGHTELLKGLVTDYRSSNNNNTPSEHLATIERAALDGASLVRKLQQYIRDENKTAFEVVDVNGLVEDSVALTKPYWYNEPRRQGISIDATLELSPLLPPIMGAPPDLRDVFVNLILNAVQAMPHGGVIAIRTVHVAGQGVVVKIRDTGTGMTDRVRARIFEPLFTTKAKRGTGMGLSVCYSTVQEHDGDIEVETDLGFGTTFTLSFPPAPSGEVMTAELKPKPSVDSRRILVVDDEPMVRSVLARLLALRGHMVVQAASGAEALTVLDRNEVDLVFTDQGMPEMNGRLLARKIRGRFSELPIVLLTGDTEAGKADNDVTRVMTKPFKLDALETVINELT
jgi:signal transduction histidine kinase